MASNKIALITGVTGFIGRYIARHFSEQGWSVIGIGTSPPENAPLANLTKYYCLRLPDLYLHEILQLHYPSICIHCAGRASVGLSVSEPGSDFYTNSVVTFELLNSLRLHTPNCKFIFLSSAAVYGNPQSLPINETQTVAPISPYGFHKLMCEQMCLEFTKVYGLPTASMRIFSAYGPGLRRQVVWDICQKAIIKGSLLLQGTGEESRDFIHALDIARALSVVVKSAPMEGEVYNLGSGREVKISELATIVLNSLEENLTLQFDGIVPLGNPLNWQADIYKLKSIGFIPTVELERGIKTFVNWCRAELVGV
ncbi:NAD-dependent epimerase/dehydratase family protein [Nostoc sp. CMAA1605]|uniref:NAD-dependent epimerase/dehydratase family protein n=1 Tax=Nostoc sp. CMAA1605 TaxID=2055159 RepID=UPI001F3DFB30|nr:SDR family oxidoreductase [Nostoc sp. CMAA1605]MCF4967954.1 dTDP-glucose 4,6-dehydratase [Nostoc sp. CMAA1605]